LLPPACVLKFFGLRMDRHRRALLFKAAHVVRLRIRATIIFHASWTSPLTQNAALI
jgi:hypothetical protein